MHGIHKPKLAHSLDTTEAQELDLQKHTRTAVRQI
jgi:hypothetical protein